MYSFTFALSGQTLVMIAFFSLWVLLAVLLGGVIMTLHHFNGYRNPGPNEEITRDRLLSVARLLVVALFVCLFTFLLMQSLLHRTVTCC